MNKELTTIDWQKLARYGLLWGVAAVYVSVIGMIESFSGRSIINNTLTLAQVLLFIPPIAAGYMIVNRKEIMPQDRNSVLMGGAAVGAISSAWVVLLIIVQGAIPGIRNVFINVSPALIEVLTFGLGFAGVFIYVAVTAVLGLIGASVHLLPDRGRRAVYNVVLTLLIAGAFGEIFTQVLRPLVGNVVVRALYTGGALNLVAAVVLVAIAGGLGWYRQENQARYEAFRGEIGTPRQKQVYQYQVAIGIILLLILPWIVGRFLSDVMVTIGLFIMMGLGLNIAIGMAGLLDLGYVTNYAVGAYILGILTTVPPDGSGYGFSFWIILPLCLFGAMSIGFVFGLPVLRMRGDYLAIATLGFGEIIRILAISEWLEPLAGGAQGVLYIPKPEIFGISFSNPQQLYYVVFAGCALVLYVSWRLNNSRTGRQWMAMREDEDVAQAMGINLVRTKLLAFTISAAAGGLAGGMFAAKLGTIFPTSFNILVSINVLSLIIVGGIGSIPGVIVGAIFLIGTPELLREFVEYRLLIYGAVLVWMMLARPEGLIPSAVRKRELKSGVDSL